MKHGSPLFIPKEVAAHGVLALCRKISELKKLQDEVGDNWPEGYDRNDLVLYESVLDSISKCAETGYWEAFWWGKPFGLFIGLLDEYVRLETGLSKQEREAIRQKLLEYHDRIRRC